MQIHDLPTGSIGSTEYTPIDNGTTNRKITLATLGDYLLNTLTTTIMGVSQTVKSAFDFVNSKLLAPRGTEIPANADLDDYLDCGSYYCPNLATGQTLANNPYTGGGFKIIVHEKAADSRTQFLLPVSSSVMTPMFLRSYSSSGWAAWRLLQAQATAGTYTVSAIATAGFITTSSAAMIFFIPLPVPSGSSVTVNSMSITARHVGGGYPYARSGSSGTTYTQLGSSLTEIWANGASKRTNEVASITTRTHPLSGITMTVTFTNALTTNTSGTAVTNNTPAAFQVTVNFTVS